MQRSRLVSTVRAAIELTQEVRGFVKFHAHLATEDDDRPDFTKPLPRWKELCSELLNIQDFGGESWLGVS